MPKAPKIKAAPPTTGEGPLIKKKKYVEGQEDILELARMAASEEGVKTNAKLQKQKSRTRKVCSYPSSAAWTELIR